MPVDRGGLEYPIKVEDEFSTNLGKFKQEIDSAAASFSAFKALLASGADLGVRVAPQTINLGAIMTQLGSDTGLAKNAFDRLNQSLRLTVNESGRVTANFKQTTSEIEKTKKSSDTLAGSITRLIQSFLIFKAIQFGTNAFSAVVQGAVDFNALLETSRLEVASVLLAVGQVSDATGQAVSGARGLELAMGEAGKQTELLRKEALQTSISFADLVKVFQVAIGPGLAAGLKLEEIRQLTVQMAQAAKAIGLDETKFASEIRLILSGTITQRTRLANALGITAEDIQRAKEAGTLAEFLQGKFGAFTVAAQAGLTTFAVLLQRAHAAVTQLVAAGTVDLFESLKGLLGDIFQKAQDPKAVEVVQALSGAFTDLVQVARQIVTAIDPDVIVSALTFVRLGVRLLQGGFEVLVIDVQRASAEVSLFLRLITGLGDSDKKVASLVAEIADLDKALDLAKQSAFSALVSITDGSKQAGSGAQSLSKQFDSLPAVIDRSAQGIDHVHKLVTDLDKDLIKANADLSVGQNSLGLTGAALAEQKALLAEQTKLKERTAVLDTNEREAASQLAGIRAQQKDLDAQIVQLGAEKARLIEQAVQGGTEQVRLTTKVRQDEEAVALAEQALQTAKRKGNAEAITSATAILSNAKESLAIHTDELAKQKQANDSIFAHSEKSAQQERDLAAAKIENNAALLVGARALDQSTQAKLDLERHTNEIVSARIRLLALENNFRISEANKGLAVQITNQERLNEAEFGKDRFVPFARQKAQLANEVDTLNEKVRVQRDTNQREIAAADDQVKKANERLAALQPEAGKTGDQKAINDATQTKIELEKQAALVRQQGIEQDRLHADQLDVILDKVQRVNAESKQPFTTGLELALDNLVKKAETAAQDFANILTGLVQRFSDTTAQLIVDAFDPSKKVDVRAAFGKLLQDLAKQVISFLIQLAITKAVLGIVGAVAGFAEGGAIAIERQAVLGRAEGGPISRGRASLAHYGLGARGFAAGLSRPAGLDSRDTVPAWLQPGEWVIRLASVRKYGQETMAAINSGLVDPLSMRALAGASSFGTSNTSAASPGGFAAGGLVPDSLLSNARQVGGSAPPARTVVVANEETFERLLAGGPGAFDRALQSRQGMIQRMSRGGP